MPPRRRKREIVTPVTATDHISALPDQMLHHVLSFLPVQAAVRTCVLARRWRHLWKSTTGLRIVGLDEDKRAHVLDLRKFMDHLIALRERTHLDTVEIKFNEFDDDDDVPYVNLWTRFAVMCKVRALTLHILDCDDLPLDDLPLVSRHLVTLDLHGVALQKTSLDFASCPALEDLKMNDCEINADRISSCSLKHLSITRCRSDSDCRVRISAPGLLSLKLEDFIGITPFLEDMALLEAASVNLGQSCKDCLNYDSGVFFGANDNTCKNCVPISDDCSSDCVLLGGISSAKHLKLMSEIGNFIFTRDLKHCPAFSKLKTLVLNEYWCEAPDLDPLACILKKSPVLEKLTLQLFSEGPNHEVEMEGSYYCMERPSAISEHLNIVEVKCDVVDKRILKILRIQFLAKARRLGLTVHTP